EHRRQEQDRADDREEREEIRAVRMPGHLRELHTIVGFERRRDERRDEIRERSEHERGAEGDERQRFRIAERHGFLLRFDGHDARSRSAARLRPGGRTATAAGRMRPARTGASVRNDEEPPPARRSDRRRDRRALHRADRARDLDQRRRPRAAPRRRAPFAVTALVFGGVVAYSVWHGSPEGLELIGPVTVAAYSVAAHAPRPR